MHGRGRRGQQYWAHSILACALALVACGRTDAAPPERPPAPDPYAEAARPVVLFLGTSLTAGYGLPSDAAFPALIQERIDAEALGFRVVNAGVSGDTSAGGLRRIEWLLRLPIAVLVLELGANDMLRGLDTALLRRNLEQIVDRVRAEHPDALLVVAGMRAAPNLGTRYMQEFEAVYPEVAQDNDGALIPFILEGVAGRSSLNQADGIHPTAEGHRRIADVVWPVLAPLLRR